MRFCCWCGKEEDTEFCESESIKEATELVSVELNKLFKAKKDKQTMITDEELRRLKELYEKATDGPWELTKYEYGTYELSGYRNYPDGKGHPVPIAINNGDSSEAPTMTDVEFIREVHNAFPALIARIEHLEAVIDSQSQL